MKDNLFKKIWNKNFVKANDKLDKFSDDIGGLRGYFSWKKLDRNNNIIQESGIHNDITNLSKSTVIRLLAQGMPKYRSDIIDPTKYKISRMRFGNASYKTNGYNYGGVKDEDMEYVKKLYYYDTSEQVFRPNESDGIGKNSLINFKSAGGKISEAISSSSQSIITRNFYIATAYKDNTANPDYNELYPSDRFGDIANGIINIPIDKSSTLFYYLNAFSSEAKLYPPAHNTLKVTLTYFNTSNEINFTEIFKSTDLEKLIYNRSLIGNSIPTSNQSGYVAYSLGADINYAIRLVYDNSLQLWRIIINLTDTYLNQNFSSNTAKILGRIKIEYNIGKYNVINSIIPKTGVNSGSSNNRFTSDDYYSLVSSVYDSSPTDFVDDYSVIFSSIMNVDQGNGLAGNSLPVIYTEAYLFNEMNDLFSSITYTQFPIDNSNAYNGDTSNNSTSRAFIKTSSDAYLFQWTIKALI